MWWDVAKTDSCPKKKEIFDVNAMISLVLLNFCCMFVVVGVFSIFLVLPFQWEWETGMHGCQPGWEVLCIDIIHYKTHKHVIQLKDQSHIKHFDVENGKCWHTLQTWNIIELNWFSSEKDRKQVEKESRHLPWDEAGQRETIFSRKISNDLSLFVTIRILLNAMSLNQVIQ